MVWRAATNEVWWVPAEKSPFRVDVDVFVHFDTGSHIGFDRATIATLV